jgi:hypothetical protein
MARTRKYKKISRGEAKVAPRKDVIDFDELAGGGRQGRFLCQQFFKIFYSRAYDFRNENEKNVEQVIIKESVVVRHNTRRERQRRPRR